MHGKYIVTFNDQIEDWRQEMEMTKTEFIDWAKKSEFETSIVINFSDKWLEDDSSRASISKSYTAILPNGQTCFYYHEVHVEWKGDTENRLKPGFKLVAHTDFDDPERDFVIEGNFELVDWEGEPTDIISCILLDISEEEIESVLPSYKALEIA